jgi:hypothetical protein
MGHTHTEQYHISSITLLHTTSYHQQTLQVNVVPSTYKRSCPYLIFIPMKNVQLPASLLPTLSHLTPFIPTKSNFLLQLFSVS